MGPFPRRQLCCLNDSKSSLFRLLVFSLLFYFSCFAPSLPSWFVMWACYSRRSACFWLFVVLRNRSRALPASKWGTLSWLLFIVIFSLSGFFLFSYKDFNTFSCLTPLVFGTFCCFFWTCRSGALVLLFFPHGVARFALLVVSLPHGVLGRACFFSLSHKDFQCFFHWLFFFN